MGRRGKWLVSSVLGPWRRSSQANQAPFRCSHGEVCLPRGTATLPSPISHNLVGSLNLPQVGTTGSARSRTKAIKQNSGPSFQGPSVGGHYVCPLPKHFTVLGLGFFICKIKGWFQRSLPALPKKKKKRNVLLNKLGFIRFKHILVLLLLSHSN